MNVLAASAIAPPDGVGYSRAMSLLHTLGDVSIFTLRNVALPIAVAAATTNYLAARSAAEQIARVDRVAGYLNEDLRRWMIDRDRQAGARMREIKQQADSMGVLHGGAVPQARGKVYAGVLHE